MTSVWRLSNDLTRRLDVLECHLGCVKSRSDAETDSARRGAVREAAGSSESDDGGGLGGLVWNSSGLVFR